MKDNKWKFKFSDRVIKSSNLRKHSRITNQMKL